MLCPGTHAAQTDQAIAFKIAIGRSWEKDHDLSVVSSFSYLLKLKADETIWSERHSSDNSLVFCDNWV